MIKEISLAESKHFKKYEYKTYLYERGIKADICIIVDGLETYYNRSEEIIYIESFEFFNAGKEVVGSTNDMSKDMLKELIKYLGWKNWGINLYYYDYEEAMITIKHIKKEKSPILKDINMGMFSDNPILENIKNIPSINSIY